MKEYMIKLVSDFDIVNNQERLRLDLVFGGERIVVDHATKPGTTITARHIAQAARVLADRLDPRGDDLDQPNPQPPPSAR